MEKLDSVVAEHIEQRLLQPKRLEKILSAVLHCRKERAERRTTHIAELHKRAAKAETKLKRLYDAIEHGTAGHGDAPVLSEGCEPLIFKTGRPVRLSCWAPLLPQRPTARAV
jgi:site-specific DNA recombinase